MTSDQLVSDDTRLDHAGDDGHSGGHDTRTGTSGSDGSPPTVDSPRLAPPLPLLPLLPPLLPVHSEASKRLPASFDVTRRWYWTDNGNASHRPRLLLQNTSRPG